MIIGFIVLFVLSSRPCFGAFLWTTLVFSSLPSMFLGLFMDDIGLSVLPSMFWGFFMDGVRVSAG